LILILTLPGMEVLKLLANFSSKHVLKINPYYFLFMAIIMMSKMYCWLLTKLNDFIR